MILKCLLLFGKGPYIEDSRTLYFKMKKVLCVCAMVWLYVL